VNISFLIAATRARLALLIAGLAWFFGIEAPAPLRIALAVLVIAALVIDGAIDEGRVRTAPPVHDRHTTRI
jgi:hypothetical protein